MTVDGCLSHPWIKNSESQGGVINKEGLSEFQAQYKLRVGVNMFYQMHTYNYKLENTKHHICTRLVHTVCFNAGPQLKLATANCVILDK